MNADGIGAPVRRVEDLRFVTGQGRYLDDIAGRDVLHAAFLRSRHAHCRILALDIAPALARPGVVAVFTGADIVAAGVGALDNVVRRGHPAGASIAAGPRPVLAHDIARHIGDPLAIVVATSPHAAEEAAAEIVVEEEPLPAVASLASAAEGALLWPHAPRNRAFRLQVGDAGVVEAAFAAAETTTSLDLEISRVTAVSMEPRSALAAWDAGTRRFELVAGTQSPHLLQAELARTLNIPMADLRVLSPDVGGSFGLKNAAFPELAALLFATRHCGQPVLWRCGRSEAFASDDHARDNFWTVELALDAQARILAVRALLRANLGAYLSTFGAHCPLNNLTGLVGPYAIATASVTVEGYFTNTSPVSAYRGAGRPEATYALERAIDHAAATLNIDRIALRRRNLVPASALPWRTPFGPALDSGDFAGTMEKALETAGWPGFATRRALSKGRGKLRGIGLANHLESAGSLVEEMAELRFDAEGTALLLAGTSAQGQGHETVFRQLLQGTLGLPPQAVRIAPADTDAVYQGRGAFGSRSAAVVSAALTGVAEQILAKARKLAAHLLECADDDLAFEAGAFRIAGTDRSIALQEVARATHRLASLPPGFEPGLSARVVWRPTALSFPTGTHVCEVEIDEDTGVTQIVSYVAVEDCGRILNPLLIEGQVHGGIAQGAGQVLMEQITYDGAGQLLTGSFMDYAVPRASDLPSFVTEHDPHPTTTNPMGVKGVGESGTVGAIPAVMNAIIDALRPLGVDLLDMPATPERVWRAMENARRKRPASASQG